MDIQATNRLQPGSLLQGGKYRIDDVLGQGGFGITYLGEHVALGRRVAIKEFFMKELCDRDGSTSHVTVGTAGARDTWERFKTKFLKEARTIAQLDDSHVVRIHDIFGENGTAYYVMEYIDGGSLEDYVNARGRLSAVEARDIACQIADALGYIHGRSILHLDVKPSNVLMRGGKEVVLIDFGVSKRYDESGSQTSTTPAGISKGYAPIEQYRQGGVSHFAPTTDIYSLGAVLYKMLTGDRPPEASVLIDEGLTIPSYVDNVAAAVIHKAMSPQRRARIQSAADFKAMLMQPDAAAEEPGDDTVMPGDDDTTVADESTKEATAAPTTPVSPPVTATSAWRKFLVWIVIAVAVVVVAAVYALGKGSNVASEKPIEEEWIDSCYAEEEEYLAEEEVKTPTKKQQKATEEMKERIMNVAPVAHYGDLSDKFGDLTASQIHERADDYYDAGNYSTALEWYLEAFRRDNTRSGTANRIGYMYDEGMGTSANATKAFEWYMKSATLGFDVGMYNVALCYRLGTGVDRDYSKAFEWYKKAAAQGNAGALCNLGYLYDNGYGCTQNLYTAFDYYRKAADKGDAQGQYNLGICYETGRGCAVDISQAKYWYGKAKAQGHADATAAYNRLAQ